MRVPILIREMEDITVEAIGQVSDQVRDFFKGIEYIKIYDAGCCEKQGIQHRGYRIILGKTYVIEWGLWGVRGNCGRHHLTESD